MVRDRMSVSITVITNRKSHTGFRLIPSSMTLNGVIALILRFFSSEFDSLLASYVTVVENRPIMSEKYCLPVPVFHFWPKLTYSAARFLCRPVAKGESGGSRDPPDVPGNKSCM